MTILDVSISENFSTTFGNRQHGVNEPLSRLVGCQEWKLEEERIFESWFQEMDKPLSSSFESAWEEVATTFVPLCMKEGRLELLQRILERYPERADILGHLQETIIKHIEHVMNDPELFGAVVCYCPNAIKFKVLMASALKLLELTKKCPSQDVEGLLLKCMPEDQVMLAKMALARGAENGGGV